jgi:phosphatidylglycerophosphate synthase
MKKLSSYRKLRKWAINDNRLRALEAAALDLTSWRHPYTRIKASLYVETAIPMIRFAERWKLTPNFITFLFIYSSLVALAITFINNPIALSIGLVIMFFNGTLDWADGALARWTGQETEIGAWFDPMAGRVKQVAFICIVAVFSYHATANVLFLYIGILNALLMVILSTIPQLGESRDRNPNSSSLSNARKKIYRNRPATKFFIALAYYDGRARYTDILILLMVLNLLYGIKFILIFPFLWIFVLSIASFYLLAQLVRNND